MAGVGLFELIIYIAQQAGIMLAVGAETVVLCAYLLDLHKKTPAHHTYAQSARFAQQIGLATVILSGLGAVVLHAATGAWDVLLAPAFIFKWILIGVVLAMYGFERAVKERGVGLEASVRAAAGGNWYALFLVHSVAPVVGWMPLLILYALWMAGFGVVWSLFVLMMRRAARPLAPAVAATKPAPNVVPVQKAAPVVVFTKPAPAVAQPEPLVMPKHIEPKPAPEAPHAPLPVLAHAELEPPHQAPIAVVVSHPAPAPAPLAHPPAAAAPKPPVHIAAAPAPAAPKDIIHRAATPPAPPPKEGENLSAVRVMPKSPDELPKAMIQFG